MRALFSMSKILMVCFALVSLINILIFLPCDILRNKVVGVYCINRIIISVIFVVIAIVFYKRTKKTMRRFLLILLGTYDAIIQLENKEKQSESGRIGIDITYGKTTSAVSVKSDAPD